MKAKLTEYQNRINQVLQTQLEDCASKQGHHSFFEALNYASLNKGKRLRPALIYAIADALEISLDSVDIAASAIELIHSYSLVHDDLPAMDDDDLRRGQPTTHIQYDEATAILVGDAQQSLAFQILSEDSSVSPKQALELIKLLSQACGANGMILGQVMDIEAEGKVIEIEKLKQLHLLKTGALIQCALLMGAVPSDRYDEIKSDLTQLGEFIGLAFQVHDDILDIESDTETLGKTQGRDLELDKSTYPKIMGLEQAKQYRDELIQSAHTALKTMNLQSEFLTGLINYIAERQY